MNLTEATMLARQGKLVENKIEKPNKVRKVKKEESIAVANDDVVVNVDDNKTEVITDEETVIIIGHAAAYGGTGTRGYRDIARR